MLIGGGGGGGYVAPPKTKRAHKSGGHGPGLKPKSKPKYSPPPKKHYSSPSYSSAPKSYGGSSKSYGGGGKSYGGSKSYAAPKPRPKPKPRLPMPSAQAIADLFDQIAGFNRQSKQLGINATAQKKELAAARTLFLRQLLDAFTQQKTTALEDFATRGLSDSGIAEEGIAKLTNAYQGQRGEYETGYTNRVAEIMRILQGRRADLLAQRQAAERRYNQLRAQRAAALQQAGYGG